MTYRNDHDAALARIDSLEQELEQLKATPAPAVVPPKRHATKLAIVASLAAMVMGGGWVAYRAFGHTSREVAVGEAGEPHYSPTERLRVCLGAVMSARADGYDARTTDPHAGGRSVAGLDVVGASCRGELAEVANAIGLSAAQRTAFQRWLAAEETLAGDLSRIAVYYANDPYKLDNYTTAPQLWREYETDRAARDATLPAVVRELQLEQPNS